MNAVLNETLNQLQNAETVNRPIAGFTGELDALRKTTGMAEWRDWITSDVRRHQLYPILLEDPMVRHSAVRPRGYPGDAELIDYIYGSGNVQPKIDGASELGRRLYQFDRTTPPPSAVRHRLEMAAAETDRLALTGMRPHILSIACGHLREAQSLKSLQNGTLGRFVGVDQDPLSLELVRREWGHCAWKPASATPAC